MGLTVVNPRPKEEGNSFGFFISMISILAFLAMFWSGVYLLVASLWR